jgi:hypothetical protein
VGHQLAYTSLVALVVLLVSLLRLLAQLYRANTKYTDNMMCDASALKLSTDKANCLNIEHTLVRAHCHSVEQFVKLLIHSLTL